MTDRRLLKSNGRVAHVSLEGSVEADRFVEGTSHQVNVQSAALLATPDGPREREILTGERFRVLEVVDQFAFGYAEKDDYVGWLFAPLLMDAREMTHWVSVARSFRKETPDIKVWERVFPLSYGARVEVVGTEGAWSRIVLQEAPGEDGFKEYVVPSRHLTPIDVLAADPVAEAMKLLGTPYLWGGNSSFGLDCSGLVQLVWGACGRSLSGDSDLQSVEGEPVTDRQPGDLLFWKGHVAMIADATRMIHANAFDMAVSLEDIDAAILRIEGQGDGPVTSHRRVR